ncbi:GNAT family N-acetyltransferase [Gudongella sp. DL1XJH-153]|uniref:GNAT family N-acetyltransferase n=1 Tax=Gudongella sp. DL1XJH-153 TaxID=3409804 RepID=UPI003BB61D8B
MRIISVRENPDYTRKAIEYFQKIWASSSSSMKVYEDSIEHCIDATNPLPQWYLLMEDDTIIGCAGLITNDFISRMDLYPWICAIYIEGEYRGNHYGSLLMDKAKEDAKEGGFSNLYLCTDHVGYYEKYGFEHIGTGYHPWGDSSRIYSIKL